MFEKTSRLAEQVATSVSRRGFLGSLGGWAATAALGVAGVLTGGRTAWAEGGKKHFRMCCWYTTPSSPVCVIGTSCPPTCCGGSLWKASGPFEVTDCRVCGVDSTGCPC
jgi:hypothetical protein